MDKKLILSLLIKYKNNFVILKEKEKERVLKIDDLEKFLQDKKTVIIHFDRNIIEVVN